MADETTVVAIGDSAMWGTGTAYRYKPPNLVHKQLNDGEPLPPVQLRARGGGLIGHPKPSKKSNRENLKGYAHSLMDTVGKFSAKVDRVPVDNRIHERTTSWDEENWRSNGPGVMSDGINAATRSVRPSKAKKGKPGKPAKSKTVWDPADDDYRYNQWRGTRPITSGTLNVDVRKKYRALNREALQKQALEANDINNLRWSVRRDIGGAHPTHLEQVDQFAGEVTERNNGEKVLKHKLDVPWWEWDSTRNDYKRSRLIKGSQEVRFYKDTDYPPVNPSKQSQKQSTTITRKIYSKKNHPQGGAFAKIDYTEDDPGKFDALDPHPPAPEEVDVVLLNGGTNDIGLLFMMNFLSHSYVSLMQRIEEYCYRDNKVLLREAREQFPNALLVLLGYPFFLSDWSNYQKAKKFFRQFDPNSGEFIPKLLSVLGTRGLPIGWITEAVYDGGMVFDRAHQHYMRKAVAERAREEAGQGTPGVMYVSRGFGAINAFEAPDTWAWSVGNDDLAGRRKHMINDLLNKQDAMNENASIGHPNRRGSIETAKAVVNRYRDRNSLEVGKTAGKIGNAGGRPMSLRGSLKSPYGLVPNAANDPDVASVRTALSHRYVDSIQLKFYRGTSLDNPSSSGPDPTPHLDASADVYLDIAPGRNGSSETFRVDYESDKAGSGTPQFDDQSDTYNFMSPPALLWFYSNLFNISRKKLKKAATVTMDRDDDTGNGQVVTEIDIDPMGGRKTDADAVGGEYHGEGVQGRGEAENNVEDRSMHRDIIWNPSRSYGSQDDIPDTKSAFNNRWDDDRLMLWQLRNATLRVTDPSYWALEKIELTINGTLTWTLTDAEARQRWGVTLEERFRRASRDASTTELTIDLLP